MKFRQKGIGAELILEGVAKVSGFNPHGNFNRDNAVEINHFEGLLLLK